MILCYLQDEQIPGGVVVIAAIATLQIYCNWKLQCEGRSRGSDVGGSCSGRLSV